MRFSVALFIGFFLTGLLQGEWALADAPSVQDSKLPQGFLQIIEDAAKGEGRGKDSGFSEASRMSRLDRYREDVTGRDLKTSMNAVRVSESPLKACKEISSQAVGVRRAEGLDGLLRVYQCAEQGGITLKEQGGSSVLYRELVNFNVNGKSARKTVGSGSSQITSILWVEPDRTVLLQMNRIDEKSVAWLETVAESLSENIVRNALSSDL
ncbi:hypothetical protein SAMN05216577_102235 [Pseudomonas citronellolis]|uniref:Uncharacterized protein n=1 Tax=Pseudomonas citronellolis TaxID=53408 RepID=A0AAQ1HJH9_9PSED|nr:MULTISPECIES: hypothetical protein [Pseudomonas]MCL6688322.1 hypothetical protein [Pseudomonas sp. R3.Fl]MDN6876051.1 hypothetical protein [Pseudomonas citronellolis]UXJ54505.1 hypothetical protein N5P21_09950 [Pseudomonas citronellolis]SFC05231.1 hypothetical protein SAMN05216577_102235 [Pseudomonas citronellolis]